MSVTYSLMTEDTALVQEAPCTDIDHAILTVQLPLRKTTTWMEDTSSSLRKIDLFAITVRIVGLCFFASLASMLPVVCPFGDPYDLTPKGFLTNSTYFVWYTGVGWGFLWMVNAMWVARILNVQLHIGGAIILPTLFAVALFSSAYIVLGGPAPLGTLSLGFLCFLVEWLCLWMFMLKEHQHGLRLLASHAGWVVLLLLYFALTVLIEYLPHLAGNVAALFPFLGELVLDADFVQLIFGSAVHNFQPDQLRAASLFKLMFMALHTTYSNFLFPVLGDVKSVLTAAVIDFILNSRKERAELVVLDAAHGRGSAAAEAYAKKIANRMYMALLRCRSPISFGCLLAFNLYGFNQGMFYTFDGLSAEQLLTCQVGIAINFCMAVASMLFSGYMCYRWMTMNPGGKTGLEGEDGVNIDLARFTVVRALQIVKVNTIDCLFDFFTLLWMTLGAVTTIVGVCMVMKHDGMDIDGWAKFLFEDGSLPYPLCPLWATGCQTAGM